MSSRSQLANAPTPRMASAIVHAPAKARRDQLVALGRGGGDGSAAAKLDPRPRNFSTEPFKQGSSVRQIFDTLGKGVPGTAMVKFTNLSEEERWALAWYVRELKDGKPER